MDDQDPISQFFPDQESVDLYEVLHLTDKATSDDIKKAYRRLALVYHPDKHASASDEARADASIKFQQIGFAYAVLSDEKRKDKYDKTGTTTEGFDLGAGEAGWEAYFEDLFERVTRGKLDEMKKEYQGTYLTSFHDCDHVFELSIGSNEEAEDLKSAYLETKGSIGEIMTYIPHSTIDDEPRFIVAITELINKGELRKMKEWEKSIKDEKARLVRKKQSDKEAKEAEALAKELDVWDEFYGSGKSSERANKRKGKRKAENNEEEEDTSALQALILKRKQTREQVWDDFTTGLTAKYGGRESKGNKSKKRGRAGDDDDSNSTYDIPDEEFANIQERLFGPNSKTTEQSLEGKPPKKKGRKAATK